MIMNHAENLPVTLEVEVNMSNGVLKLLVYASDGKQQQRLLTAINRHRSQFSLEILGDIHALNVKLRHEITGEIWLVLITVNSVELRRLTKMKELIRNTRSIFILPDQTAKTVAAGHMLYPRFVSYVDCDYSDVSSVLGKIICKRQAKHNPDHY